MERELTDLSGATKGFDFEEAVHRHLDRAYRLAGLILGSSDGAEDATQEALLRAWQARNSLREGERFPAWFDRILLNVCRDRLRRQRRITFVQLQVDAPTTTRDPFAEVLDRDELGRVIATLDPDARMLVVLRFWADLPIDEIASRLNVPAGTVKSRLHRTLGDVADRLNQATKRSRHE